VAYIINCEEKKELFGYIKRELKKRGLKIADPGGWEVHGPHAQDFEYQVFVGTAKGLWGSLIGIVVIYPWGVWEIDDSRFWNRPTGHEGERIIIKKRR